MIAPFIGVLLVILGIFVGTYVIDYLLWGFADDGWRFSLRSLLIATTFIAVLLGLAAAYLRVW